MELNEKWKEQAETFEDNLPYPFDGGTFGEYKSYDFGFERGFIKGAQTYADAVEKMLLSYKEKYQTIIDNRNSIQEERNHARVMLAHTNKQLEELKSIQP